MGFTHSRSALTTKLEQYEVEALIDWHRAQEFTFADDGDYPAAQSAKQRREDLEQQLSERREEMKAEALELTKKNLASQFPTGERA